MKSFEIIRVFPALLLLFFCGNFTIAQEPDIPRFGKDVQSHLEMERCEIDSNADAAVLFDDGDSYIRYDKQNGNFYLEIERHQRVKIFNKDGFRWADISIPLHQAGSEGREKLVRFKAATYTLKDGKIKKSKLRKRDVLQEEVNENLALAKFTMPKVEEGAVIEYTYKVTSDFIYNLQPWEFQTEIPTLVSYYKVSFPEFYKYNLQISGYEKIEADKTQQRESIALSSKSNVGGGLGGVRTNTSTHRVSYNMDHYTFYAYDIPKLRDEPFLDNKKNYQSRIDFELLYTEFPNQERKQYASNWGSVTKTLLDRNDFGGELRATRFLSEDIQQLTGSMGDEQQKMFAILSHIRDKIKWNEKYRLLTEKGIKKAYQEGSGNSAEVNLCLVAALREAGIDAFPIALSTRSSGIIHQWQVSISKFNHVIAGAVMGENFVSIDATVDFSAPNVLPLECLNGQARIIEEERSNWVDLNPIIPSKTLHRAEFSITKTDAVEGMIQQNFFDHAALNLKSAVENREEEERVESTISDRFEMKEVKNVKLNQKATPRPVINLQYHSSIPNSVIHAGNLIYLTPGKGLLYTENPLKKPDRKLPINFHFPSQDQRMFSYEIPEGYSVEELPQNAELSVLDGKLQYQYNAKEMQGKVVVTITLAIIQPTFSPDQYEEIKSFFSEVVAQNNQRIIFKKS